MALTEREALAIDRERSAEAGWANEYRAGSRKLDTRDTWKFGLRSA